MIKERFKKLSFSALAFLTVLVPVSLGVSSTAFAEEDITLDLETKSNVDVVLSIGNTTRDMASFESLLYGKLSAIGVDTRKVNISAVETVSQNLQNSFVWEQHVSSSVGSISLQNSGASLQMYGNPSNPGFNKIFTNVADVGIKSQEMSFSYNLNYGDSFDGAGIMVNTQVTNGLMNGYAIFIPQSGNGNPAQVYRLTNWGASNSQDIRQSNNATVIASIPMGSSGNFKIQTTKDKLTVIKNNVNIGTVSLPVHSGWGFGFFSDHYSHGCSDIGQFSLTNLSLAKTMAKDFKEVIRIPEWRDNTEKLMVHIDTQTVPDFDSPTALGEIIPRLSNEGIHLLTYGNSVNKTQFEKVLAMNNNNGAYYDTSSEANYNTALTNTANYIRDLINGDASGGQYVLVGKPIDVNVNPAHLKVNTATPEYPNGKWKIDHDYNYFENNSGQASWANQYQNSLVMTFDKPGRYEVGFGNTHPEPRYIYAHREPIASFSVSFTGNGATLPLNYIDRSYDPDRESTADKGVKQREWKWRETDSAVWNNGQLTTVTNGKNYIVQLRVKDEYGVWSNSVQKYVTTNASTSIEPIADFNVSPTDITRYETLRYDDYSYTPNGLPITSREWKVYNSSGTMIHNSSVPLTSFAGLALDRYKITLKVRNSSGVESEIFTRFVNVVRDALPPEAIINPTTKEWTNSNYAIDVSLADVGGSGFRNQQYALTTSPTYSAIGLSSPSTSPSFTVPINNDGIYYLHLTSSDNEGNVMKRTSGPYKLDKTAPNVPVITLSKTGWTAPIVSFNIADRGDGTGSGVKTIQYRINGGSWKTYSGTVNIPEDLAGRVLVESRAIDGVGNTSAITSETALIDDKDPIINSVVINNYNDTTKQLVVDAIDNESGIMEPGYKYYQKIVGKDSDFKELNGGWIKESSILLPKDKSSTKYIYKVEVRDGNRHHVFSNEIAYVSAPIISFAGIKEGDFDNTVTVDFSNSIGSDVKVKVYREGTYVALVESGNIFVDEGLDYERDYNYTFVATSDFNGNEITSFETSVKVSIGKPTLEMSLDSKQYYRTTFSKDFAVTGDVIYRKGGVVLLTLYKNGVEVSNTSVNVIPYSKVKWSLKGIQLEKENVEYVIKADLKGFENVGLYKREFKVNVKQKDPVIKSK